MNKRKVFPGYRETTERESVKYLVESPQDAPAAMSDMMARLGGGAKIVEIVVTYEKYTGFASNLLVGPELVRPGVKRAR